jgi:pyruvate ferredoxin oxidoreductase alpha subunit
MAIRDMGWLLCWVTTPQEALEHVLIGYRIAEDKKVRMPMGLAMDGAFLTHSQHMVKIPSVDAAKRFLPQYDRRRRLHPDNPSGGAAERGPVMEPRQNQSRQRARVIIKDAEFNDIFGERYAAPYYFDEFMTDDAEVVLIGIGTVAAPARTAVRPREGTEARTCAGSAFPDS